jgi:hypothetical protein
LPPSKPRPKQVGAERHERLSMGIVKLAVGRVA